MGRTTTTQLLEALLAPGDEETWRIFDARYRPIIFSFARRLDLDADDASEIAQQTLVEFVRSYRAGGYQRDRGRLRAWIMGIARHRVIDMLRERQRRRACRGESAMVNLPGEDHLSRIWSAVSERVIFEAALRELRQETKTEPKTIDAFERLVIGGATAGVVAAEFDLTVEEVYRVKNRITKRLRGIVERLTEDWDEAA